MDNKIETIPNTSKKVKFIAVCGGSASGIGKGITVSSIALILKSSGYRVTMMKIDPYLVLITIILIYDYYRTLMQEL